VNTPTSEKIVTKLKLTRNEILDLAVSSFSDQLFAEAKRYYDTMKAKKAEVEEIRKEIKKHQANSGQFDPMIEDLNVTCARICRSYGMKPCTFEMNVYVYGDKTDLRVQMLKHPTKEVKTRKAPARLAAKMEKLEAEATEAQSKGLYYQNKMRELENIKVGDEVKWDDPDDGLCSQIVTVVRKTGDVVMGEGETIIVRPYPEGEVFEVLAQELFPLPKPNEVWRTQIGNFVLVVEHPMTEIEGNLGFIWFDAIDGSLNFSPVRDQLVERMNLNVAEWGLMMGKLTDPERS